MYEIQRIRPLSLARIMMLITSVLHVVAGLVLTLVYDGLGISALASAAPDGVNSLSLLLVWMSSLLVVLPLSFAVGALAAVLYNLFAGWWGGLHIDLAKVTPKAATAKPSDAMPEKE